MCFLIIFCFLKWAANLDSWTEIPGNVVVKNNIFDSNGGNPLHFEMYEDFDMAAHPEDWKYKGEQRLFLVTNNNLKSEIDKFTLKENVITKEVITAKPGS